MLHRDKKPSPHGITLPPLICDPSPSPARHFWCKLPNSIKNLSSILSSCIPQIQHEITLLLIEPLVVSCRTPQWFISLFYQPCNNNTDARSLYQSVTIKGSNGGAIDLIIDLLRTRKSARIIQHFLMKSRYLSNESRVNLTFSMGRKSKTKTY